VDLSDRESEVLAAIGEGRTNAQIGRRLHISVRTVESHVSSLLRKYAVADRHGLAEIVQAAEALRSARPIIGLPASRTSFVGREGDRDAVLDALATDRLVTLVGLGGMGKTRLASVVAEAAAEGFPAGGAFVDLVPVRDGFVLHAVAHALGVTEQPPQPLERTVIDRLSEGRSLLVLDNCEHVIDEASGLLERLLAGCPTVTVLATSRERLAVPGERLVPVPPLPLASDAERLFTDRARDVALDFAADPDDVSDLCAQLDGMPLAIELAAARVASLGLDGLRTALEDRLRLLAGGRQRDERHQSMRAVIAWSYDLLDSEERAAFRRLSSFVGGFDLDAALAVDAGPSRAAIADLVGRLADKSLLVHRHSSTGAKWRMLESVRAFGLDQLAERAESDEARRRYVAWAASTATALESRIDGEWRAEFDEVADDLRAALALTSPAPERTAHRLARSLGHLTFARRSFVGAIEHYRLAADRAGDVLDAVADLRSAAAAAIAVGDGSTAHDLALSAADRAGSDGADNARAVALAEAVITVHRYATGFTFEVSRERTSALLAEAEAIADPDDPQSAAILAAARAWEGGEQRHEATDLDLASAAVDAARRTGQVALVAGAQDALVTATAYAGRMRAARAIADDRLRLVESLPDHEPLLAIEVIDAYYVAAAQTIGVGDLPAALALGQQADGSNPLGDHPYLGLQVVQALALSGRFREALANTTTMWDNWRRDGSPERGWLSAHTASAALASGMLGDLERYRLWRSRSCEIARVDDPADSRYLATFSAFVDARVAIQTGQPTDAARLVERAYAPFERRWYEGYARAAGAELAVVAGLPDARERLAAAEPYGKENDWAAACLARAIGRLDGAEASFEAAVSGFERIGAEFERACTLLLLPGRADDGRVELTRLGCPLPFSESST